MAEKNYEFRARMSEVHKRGMRDDGVWTKHTGLVVTDSFEIVYPKNAEETTRYAAYDLMEYFRDSMEMHLKVRDSADIRAESAAPAGKIVLGTCADLTDLVPESEKAAAHWLVVKKGGVIVSGRSGRGVIQGCCEIESRMNALCGPVLKEGEWDRAPLFSPRMVHSGYDQDVYPDQHLRAISHAGMDAILVFVKDVDTTPHAHLDFNDLIRRAAGFGIDVYAYSYLISEKHPDDPDAAAHYESTYGRLFDRCPGFKGVIMVGESCEFPSKDPHVVPYNYRVLRKHPELNPNHLPSPGWYPCEDYPKWIRMVRDIIRKRNPEADFVFWTYNWGWADEEARVKLLQKIPDDISLQATYEMFETFDYPGNVHARCTDYTLFFEGPGKYFSSEAKVAGERGIRMYTMSNTGGLTWDVGVIPYEPCPEQWNRRWEGLIKAHDETNLEGLMECHHYGFYPSFISEMARARYWSPRVSYEDALRTIVVRDYTEAYADDAVRALHLFSEGIRHCISTNEDQYGPFRIGPSYPLLFQKPATIPSASFAMHGGNTICNPMYSYDLQKIDSLRWEIDQITQMRNLFREGVEILQNIEPHLTGRRLDEIRRLIALGEFIWRSAQTTLNVKAWYLKKCDLLAENGDRERLIQEMLSIAEAEIANAEATVPLVEYDSRLGYEPSMDYMCDRAHLEWKIDVTRKAMAELTGPIHANDRKPACIWESDCPEE